MTPKQDDRCDLLPIFQFFWQQFSQKAAEINPPGTDVMILKIFSSKNSDKMAFLTQSKAKLSKKLIITLVFEKNADFFRQKLSIIQKIVIIISTPSSYQNGFVAECGEVDGGDRDPAEADVLVARALPHGLVDDDVRVHGPRLQWILRHFI
jgi:hypothetical protein